MGKKLFNKKIENTADTESITAFEATDLNGAAANGQIKIVKSLLDSGAKINAKDADGWTPLMEAACWGHKDIVKLLIKTGADVDLSNKEGVTALMFAVNSKKDNERIAKLLIEAGANVNAYAADGYTALMLAVKSGYTNIVQMLIGAGADLDLVNFVDGKSSLEIAIDSNNKEITNLLKTEAMHRTSLPGYKRKSKNNFQIWQSRLCNRKIKDSELLNAIKFGAVLKVKELIKAGANVNARDRQGDTALMKFLILQSQELTKLLLSARTDVNAVNKKANTALMYAASFNLADTVKLLLTSRARVNVVDKYGRTPLIYAANHGNPEIINLLLKAGANINAIDKYGKTALIYAIEDKDSVNLLLNAGADVNTIDKYGRTPLAFAHDAEVVQLLLKYGAKKSHETTFTASSKIIEKNDLDSSCWL